MILAVPWRNGIFHPLTKPYAVNFWHGYPGNLSGYRVYQALAALCVAAVECDLGVIRSFQGRSNVIWVLALVL